MTTTKKHGVKGFTKRGIVEGTRTAYNWLDRDPIKDFAATAMMESGMSYKEIYEAGGATPATLRRYRNEGGTAMFSKVMATIRACGGDLEGVTPKGARVKIGKK